MEPTAPRAFLDAGHRCKRMSMRPPRLLIVVRGEENYGVATKLLSLAESFGRRGWQITTYLLGEGEYGDRAARLPGMRIELDPARPHRFVAEGLAKVGAYAKVLKGSAAFVGRLRRYMRRERFDAMIFCEHGLVLPIAAAVRGTGTPVFWLMPNIVSGHYPADLNRRLYQAAFTWSGMIPVANSSYTRMTLGRAAARATQFDLGVDPAPFDSRDDVDPLAGIVPAGAIRLSIIARLTEEKGQLELLRGLLAAKGLEQVHLVLCGGPLGSPYDALLRATADAAGAEHRLHMIGPVASPAPYFKASHVVTNARLDPEPFGLSVVEAMLASRPVLAHRLGGPADIVVDGETGWLLDAMDEASVVRGLERMMADRARWSEMGEAGRARALARYTVDTMTDHLTAIFAENGVAAAKHQAIATSSS